MISRIPWYCNSSFSYLPSSTQNTHVYNCTNMSNRLKDIVNDVSHKHPLQRLESPSRQVSAIVHILGLASFAYSFHYLSTHPNEINQSYGWHFQYLTIIGLALATTTFFLGLLADVTLSRQLFFFKNILSCCSAPMETLISVLYWGIRAIDPELVVPKELELPLTPDLSFHLAPSVMLVLDLLFLSPPWAISVLPALALSMSIAFAYWFWIELCYSKNGFYPYPLFALMNTNQRIGLFVGSAVFMTLSTIMLKWVYGKINGLEKESRSGNVKKLQ